MTVVRLPTRKQDWPLAAIETRHDRAGARIIATAPNHNERVEVPYPGSGLTLAMAHRAAAAEFAGLLGWDVDRMVGGFTRRGFVFVFDQ